MNVSITSNVATAKTRNKCAEQRAENLAILGVKSVLELCVGPSLRPLEAAYKAVGISVVTGNDIESRWRDYYPEGSWIIGDARTVDTSAYDAVVFAPPLSKGCTGTRADSLSVDEVFPPYTEFLNLKNKVVVLVLPGRTLSVKNDKPQLHRLLSRLHESRVGTNIEVVPLKDKVTKYVDIYSTMR